MQWGTNVVGHFLLNYFLLPTMLSTAKASSPGSVRTIWVSSDGHAFAANPDGITWDDVNHEKTPTSRIKLYGQSKAGGVIMAAEMARRYGEQGLVSIVSRFYALITRMLKESHSLSTLVV
jgi:retinol dehydrogenase-12